MSEGIFHDMMTLEEFLSEWHNDSPSVLVHTSGSTGQLVTHDLAEIDARAVSAFWGARTMWYAPAV